MNLKELEEIDEPIRDIIKDLNLLGYETTGSCAGYRYPGHQDQTDKSKLFHGPYVIFYSTIEKAHKLNDEVSLFLWDIMLFEGQFEMGFNIKYGGKSQKAKKWSWEGVRTALNNIKRERRL